MVLELLALAASTPALASSDNAMEPTDAARGPAALEVSTALDSCGTLEDEVLCKLDVSYNALPEAASYSAAVTRADGSVVDYGGVAPGGTSLWVPYVGSGTYSVRVTGVRGPRAARRRQGGRLDRGHAHGGDGDRGARSDERGRGRGQQRNLGGRGRDPRRARGRDRHRPSRGVRRGDAHGAHLHRGPTARADRARATARAAARRTSTRPTRTRTPTASPTTRSARSTTPRSPSSRRPRRSPRCRSRSTVEPRSPPRTTRSPMNRGACCAIAISPRRRLRGPLGARRLGRDRRPRARGQAVDRPGLRGRRALDLPLRALGRGRRPRRAPGRPHRGHAAAGRGLRDRRGRRGGGRLHHGHRPPGAHGAARGRLRRLSPPSSRLPPLAGSDRVQEANGHVETARYIGFGLGPVLGALLYAAGGLELAMLVDAATFAAVAVAALALRCGAASPLPTTPSRSGRATESHICSATGRSRW